MLLSSINYAKAGARMFTQRIQNVSEVFMNKETLGK